MQPLEPYGVQKELSGAKINQAPNPSNLPVNNEKSCDLSVKKERTLKERSLIQKFEAVFSILLYCCASIAATVLNRYILADLNLGLNCLLLVVQCGLSIILLFPLRYFGLIKFRLFRNDDFFKWIPISFALAGMVFTGTKVLEHCAISVVTVFKNTSVLFVALGDRFLFDKKHSYLSYFSFLAIIISSLFGLYNDHNHSPRGAFWLVLNCVFSATYILSLKGMTRVISYRSFDAVFNNNLIMVSIFFILSPFLDKWSVVLNPDTNPFLTDKCFRIVLSLLVSSIAAFAISTGTIWAVRATSPTTFSMISVLNKLPVSFSGMIFLKSEAYVDIYRICSIFLGFLAGALYSLASHLERRKKPLTTKA